MKRRVAALPLLVLLCAIIPLAGCASWVRTAGAPHGDVAEAQVRAVIHRFFTLAEARDWDAIGDLFAADFAIYTDGAAIYGKRDYIALLKQDDLVVESWELRNLEVSVAADGHSAWSRYRGQFRCLSHGERRDVETAETLILRRDGGGWQIVHAHASVKSLE
jgi:ketosteroid isomerase-like protein